MSSLTLKNVWFSYLHRAQSGHYAKVSLKLGDFGHFKAAKEIITNYQNKNLPKKLPRNFLIIVFKLF